MEIYLSDNWPILGRVLLVIIAGLALVLTERTPAED